MSPDARRWLFLLVPVTVVTLVLLGMNGHRPAADGAMIVRDVTTLPLDMKGELTLESFGGAGGIVVSGADLTISGDSVLVDGQPAGAATVQLFASDDATMQIIAPHPLPNSVRFRSEGSLTLRHDQRPAGRGFDVDVVPTKGTLEGRLLFAEAADAATLLLRGYRTAAGTTPAQIVVARSGGHAAVHLFAKRAGARALSIHYRDPGTGEVEIFPRNAATAIRFASDARHRLLGTTRLVVGGRSVGDFEDMTFELGATELTFSKPLFASRAGFSTKLSGRIGRAFSVNGDQREPLLPSALSHISPMAAIAFSAIAYVIDKIVTVTKFVKSGE